MLRAIALTLLAALGLFGQYYPPLGSGGGGGGGNVNGGGNLTHANAVICVSSSATVKECTSGTTATLNGAIAPQSNQQTTQLTINGGGLQVSSASSSFGVSAYPYPGRIVSIFNNVNAGLGFALGLDIHPNLTATANNDALRGMWVSPDSFVDGAFTGVTHGGIHNAGTLEQTAKVVGSQISGDAGVQTKILDIGQDGTSATVWDLESLGGARLYGITLLPSLFNGAAGGNTIPSMYGIDMKVNSSSLNANTLTEQTGIHIQAGAKDANTTITNKYGLYVENPASASAGSTVNEGIHNVGTLNQVAAATFGAVDVAALSSLNIVNSDPGFRFKVSPGGTVADNNQYEMRAINSGTLQYLQLRTINDANAVFATTAGFWHSGCLQLIAFTVDCGAGNIELNAINMNAKGQFFNTADGKFRMTDNAGTHGVNWNLTTDAVAKLRLRDDSADASLTALNGTFSGPLVSTSLALGGATIGSDALGITGTSTQSGLATQNGGVAVVSSALSFSGAISSAAWTTNGLRIKSTAATFTDTSSSGTVAAAYTNVLGGNTIAASSSTTFTNYFNTYVKAPAAGTNVTITNNFALGADSALVAGTTAFGPAITACTGTSCFYDATASTGATKVSIGQDGSASFGSGHTSATTNQFNIVAGQSQSSTKMFQILNNSGGSSFTLDSSGNIGVSNQIQINSGNTNDLRDLSARAIFIGNTADLQIGRTAAASLRLGAADAASPVAQTLGVQSVVAGTSNTAGANFTIQCGAGTGTGVGGSCIFQTAAAGGSGTSQNAFVTALTIDSTQKATFAGTLKANAYQSSDGTAGATVTTCTGFKNGLCISGT